MIASLLAKYMNQIRKEIIPNFKPKPVFENVAPPAGVPGMAGMNSEAIRDPIARAKYEEAIQENKKNNITNSRQTTLRNIESRLGKVIADYIALNGSTQ